MREDTDLLKGEPDPGRRRRYNHGPRPTPEPDTKPRELRTYVLCLLENRAEPLTAAEILSLLKENGVRRSPSEVAAALDDLVRRQLLTTRRWRKTPTGPLTTHYELTR